MSACQLTECFLAAEKVVIYIELNNDNSSVMVDNKWDPIPNPNTSIFDVVSYYKKTLIM